MIYAIGDIHGQHTMLCALLDRLVEQPLLPEDTLVFLGDYVDRGENSRAVIETLLQLRDSRPGSVFLRGNHEQLMLDANGGLDDPHLRAQAVLSWLQNGGAETLQSYSAPGFDAWWETADSVLRRVPAEAWPELEASLPSWLEVIPPRHWEFLQSTCMDYVTPRYHFVHAGLLAPGQNWESEGWTIDPRLWIREPFLSSRADFGGRVVVFGHTPQRSGRPLIRPNKIGLDTGAVFGGPLTAGAFPSGSETPCFIQVPHVRGEGASPAEGRRTASARPRASSARSSRK